VPPMASLIALAYSKEEFSAFLAERYEVDDAGISSNCPAGGNPVKMIRNTDRDAVASVIRSAFCIGAAGVLLSACGGSSMPRASNDASNVPTALKNNKIFDYTGKKQTFVVPVGVTRLSVIARGAWGVGNTPFAAYPGRVYALIGVHGGDKLYVFVGGAGVRQTGGFNGGGSGGNDGSGSGGVGYGGAGASDVRIGGDALKDRIVVAAGGGGAGNGMRVYLFDSGGDGGGMVGDPGIGGATSRSGSEGGGGGGGGAQTEGGSGGTGGQGSSGNGDAGENGVLGSGGNGGNGDSKTSYAYGGGGGGYYGGGGGGGAGLENTPDYFYCGSCNGGGGGGGSSYVEPSAIKSQMWTGWRQSGNGRVIFSWN
jgi:hypothetical protein